jgi:hypothetical protein
MSNADDRDRAVQEIAEAVHREDVRELGPRITVENPPLPTEWDQLDDDDRWVYWRCGHLAIEVLSRLGWTPPV